MVEGQYFLGLGWFQAQGIAENFLDLTEPPLGLLLKQGFQFCQGLIPPAAHSTYSGWIFKGKILAKIVLFPVLYPFGGGLPALVVSI
jgi:hypothetical protein